MVIRSGIILPFQYRDTKKLLMCGVPEENRELTFFDLKNVVRAAFGIYNFEFRNKKIGFNIPDELLLHYLAQRHDLTNFVLEINQVFDEQQDNNQYAIYSHCRCGAQKMRADSSPPEPTNLCQPQATHTPTQTTLLPNTLSIDEQECLQAMKLRIAHIQNNVEEKAAGSSTASDLPMNATYEPCSPKMDCDSQEELLPDSPSSQHHQQQQQQQQLLHHQVHEQQQHDEERYLRQHQHQQHIEALLQEQHNSSTNNTSNMNINNNNSNNSNSMPPTTPTTNNIRQRKERMSKRQKELYVTFLQQYPFINEHRRNDPALDSYWHKLANQLNAIPQGAVKHVTEWKQTFDNWRYRVFLYARFNSKLRGEEALNPRNFKPLTRTDKHAYAIWIQNPDTAPPDLDKMRNVFVNLEETQQE